MKKIILILSLLGVGVVIGYQLPHSTPESSPTPEELTEWETLQLAMVKTESEFNPSARGSKGDWGILQETEIYVKDVNRILGKEVYTHEDAFIPEKAVEMFNIIQHHYNPKQDIQVAIHLHNPRDKHYVRRVMRNVEEINKYEKIRAVITN